VFALILETLSSTELLFILVIALIFFGPRKLPQLARSMGKGLAEFRKASDDFKRTWEREVALEAAKFDFETDNTIHPTEQPEPLVQETITAEPVVETVQPEMAVARGDAPEPLSQSAEPLSAVTEPAAPEPLRKQDWL
jgi:TatA/E family protein of Tat protein translocase